MSGDSIHNPLLRDAINFLRILTLSSRREATYLFYFNNEWSKKNLYRLPNSNLHIPEIESCGENFVYNTEVTLCVPFRIISFK